MLRQFRADDAAKNAPGQGERDRLALPGQVGGVGCGETVLLAKGVVAT